MDFLTDSLATGLALVFGGAYAVLASLPARYKPFEWIASFLFVFFLGSPLAGLDMPVPWPPFLEICLGVGIFLFMVALVRYGQRELAEGEYD